MPALRSVQRINPGMLVPARAGIPVENLKILDRGIGAM
jgi:hypothetical protein